MSTPKDGVYVHKVVKGKQGCDEFRRKMPPISEAQIVRKQRNYWMDLCRECIAEKRIGLEAENGGVSKDTGETPEAVSLASTQC